jgi:fatty aldehyde-generating acyl-ACP reductase
MGSQSARVDFALIGHQESWPQISRLVQALRNDNKPRLSEADIRDIVPWIPPRTVMRTNVASHPSGDTVRGIYVESFITPDELGRRHFKRSMDKISDSIRCAAREGATVATLGGFASIVLESRMGGSVPILHGVPLTTGNTLTASLIVQGVIDAATRVDVNLADSRLLIIGSTGDIGSACARYLGPEVRTLMLTSRGRPKLQAQLHECSASGVIALADTNPENLLPDADIVICAASMVAPTIDPSRCKPGALICDAGYPKNVRVSNTQSQIVFWGGLGQSLGGWDVESGVLDAFYQFPGRHVGHGCLLEAIVLAMEKRYESYSFGRGNIMPKQIDEIAAMASHHGIVRAPFMNHEGLWPDSSNSIRDPIENSKIAVSTAHK